MEKLLGKKVLLFSPFGTCKHYTDGCVTELESRGAEVRVYDERPSQASFTKIYMYLFKKVVPQYFFIGVFQNLLSSFFSGTLYVEKKYQRSLNNMTMFILSTLMML